MADSPELPIGTKRSKALDGQVQNEQTAKPQKIRCDACPVMCFIAEGRPGACDRYANHSGELVRLDPLTIIESAQEKGVKSVPFLQGDGGDWDGDLLQTGRPFVTAIGAGTTYPD